jgi:hypothetical protein
MYTFCGFQAVSRLSLKLPLKVLRFGDGAELQFLTDEQRLMVDYSVMQIAVVQLSVGLHSEKNAISYSIVL